jgi:hypothetical protein
MAQAENEPALMTKAEIKPLLRLSRRRPISCAICMTKDGEGVVLLNRRVKPRKVMAQMRRDAKEAGLALNFPTLRFGRAAVEGGSDSQKVTFTVNKLVPGAMDRALLLILRPAGYQRCEIVVDEGLESETDEGEEGEGDDDDEYGGGPAKASETAEVSSPGSSDEPGASALRGVLMRLVKEMVPVIEHEPDRKPTLVGLAEEGQKNLKGGDIEAAAHSIHDLDTALHEEAGSGQHGRKQGPL